MVHILKIWLNNLLFLLFSKFLVLFFNVTMLNSSKMSLREIFWGRPVHTLHTHERVIVHFCFWALSSTFDLNDPHNVQKQKYVFQGGGAPTPMSSPPKNILCQVGLIFKISQKLFAFLFRSERDLHTTSDRCQLSTHPEGISSCDCENIPRSTEKLGKEKRVNCFVSQIIKVYSHNIYAVPICVPVCK